MRAMVLQQAGQPLIWQELSLPEPTDHEILIAIEACAVCRTDLHVVDDELPAIKHPIVPGHQVVGRVLRGGSQSGLEPGTRVGVAWLGKTCGQCSYCMEQRENLCDQAQFNGYQINGGFAEQMLADSRYVFPLPDNVPAENIAPLLCGGLIGYRSLTMTGNATNIGIYGFGSAAHMITQLAVFQGRNVFAFTRPDDINAQQLAQQCGARWAGSTEEKAPQDLDAAIIFAPAGELVPQALGHLRKGGVVVCGGIHMTDIPAMPYALLWGERMVRSVANMTRADGHEFLALARAANVQPQVETLPLRDANTALQRLRVGEVQGTLVLQP